MKLISVPIALALVLALALPAAAGKSAFTGEWIGNDPPPSEGGDGSTVHLYVTGGEHAKITFTDEFGSVCVNFGSPVTFFRSTLTAVVYGDLMVATFRSAHCGPVPLQFLGGENVPYELDDQGNADPSDDTLFDGSVLWHRV